MKSLMLLWQQVADETANWCCTCATMDFKKVQERCKHEGLSFLTITLPNFGKDFEKSLDQKKVDRSLFQGFTWRAGLPLFLGGFLDHVFDRNDGRLLENPSIDAIFAIRQLTLMFSKISLPCSDARERKAMLSYLKCEEDVRAADRELSSQDRLDFSRVSAMLYSRAFSGADRDVYYLEDVVPKHGPGATADGLRGNAKFTQNTWTARLEEILPSGEFLLPNWSFYDHLESVDILEPGAEIPVRVISVPKTLKTPRIIGIEPTAMQYAQQSLLPVILRHLRKDKYLNKMLGFQDQQPNQLMAQRGSLYGDLATLDLSEASDRVSNEQVRALLVNFPHLHKAVDASRSRKARVPGHGVVRLAKFASMGSALCFPFEAMVFLTIVFIGIERELNRPLRGSDIRRLSSMVRIYGDDIIIPVDFVRSVNEVLLAFGSKVNFGKSFWNGKFRESCGKEYFNGHDVSIVKVRQVFPTSPRSATEFISLVSLRNQFYWTGLWQTTRWLDDRIRKMTRHFPTVLPTAPVLGRHSVLGYETHLNDKHLHKPMVKGYVVSSVSPRDPLDGSGALLKCLLEMRSRERISSLGNLPVADEDHLERTGRPHAVDTKLGYAPPF